MKLIITIVRDEDSETVSQTLVSGGFRVTQVASTGGFLRRGSTTLMIGVDDAQVDAAIEAIRQAAPPATEPGARRATLFVLPVENFTQI